MINFHNILTEFNNNDKENIKYFWKGFLWGVVAAAAIAFMIH